MWETESTSAAWIGHMIKTWSCLVPSAYCKLLSCFSSFLTFAKTNFLKFILSVQILPVSWITFWHNHNEIHFHFLLKWLFMLDYYFSNFALRQTYFNQNIFFFFARDFFYKKCKTFPLQFLFQFLSFSLLLRRRGILQFIGK